MNIPYYKRLYQNWQKLYATHTFLILVVCAILLAYAYQPLGATYLYPQITATWVAVMIIFILAGMSVNCGGIVYSVFIQSFHGICRSITTKFGRQL